MFLDMNLRKLYPWPGVRKSTWNPFWGLSFRGLSFRGLGSFVFGISLLGQHFSNVTVMRKLWKFSFRDDGTFGVRDFSTKIFFAINIPL